MAITQTLRFLLKKYGLGSDPHPNREEFNLMIDAIENNAAMFSQGNTAGRPAAGKRGRFYLDDEALRMYYDNGTAWIDLNPNGGGGAAAALAIGAAGAEGVSARAARADHKHPLPLATSAAPGGMSAADKAKLDAATPNATAAALVLRDASSRISVGTPTNADHAASKGYTDGLIGEALDYTEAAIKEVGSTCTSTTRPANPALGQQIYETDTKRTRQWDGAKWECIRQPTTLFTPNWNGFQNLGGGFYSGGSYTVIGPRMVRANMWLKAGDGALMGAGRLSVSLPFTVGGYPQQFGIGSLLNAGPGGVLRQISGATGGGATAIELWAWPNLEFQNSAMRTIGEAGYPFGKDTEIHFNFTFEAESI